MGITELDNRTMLLELYDLILWLFELILWQRNYVVYRLSPQVISQLTLYVAIIDMKFAW